MSNITKFLSNRELGFSKSKWSVNDKVQDYYDEIGSKPLVNKTCSLSRRCRATFLVDFSPDRTKIASTHGDHSVRITEAATGKCTHVLEGHPRTPWCLAFHPSSNQILASGCLDGEVRIWDLLGGGSEVWQCEDHSVIASLAFHPTDNVLVFATANKVYFWDWTKPEPFACCTTKHDYERVRWIKFHPYGDKLYTGITNNTTLHPLGSSRVSFMGGRESGQSQRSRGLSNVYDNLVECFQTYQRGRVINLATAGSGPVVRDPDLDMPQSPVHEEGLSFARQYAQHITETASADEANNNIVPEDQQGPSNRSVPPVLSEDLSWSPPPRSTWSPPPRSVTVEEEEIDLSEASIFPSQPRPVVILPSSHNRPEPPCRPPRARGAGIIGGQRSNIFQRQIYGEGNTSGFLPLSRRSGAPSSGERSALDHNRCDEHCNVCKNYRRNPLMTNCSHLHRRQRRLENRRQNCRNRLLALRRSQSSLPGFNERSSIHSEDSPTSILNRYYRETDQNKASTSQSQSEADGVTSARDQRSNVQEGNATGQSVDERLEISSNQERTSANTTTSSLTENYDNIRSNFVSITARLEREMNELDRRINNLRNSFQESIRQLQVNHGLTEEVEDLNVHHFDRDVPLNRQVTRPVITVTGCRESHEGEQNQQGNQQSRDRTHLLETALRTSVSSPRQASARPVVSLNQSARSEMPSNTWQTLQRHHLHPHYSSSILDDTINRPQDAVQRAINHTIAGALIGRGEAAVASNIVNQTYRIQQWDMLAEPVPDISDEQANIVVPHCKLHNDASCDISQDGTLLATFAPCHRGFPDDNIMAVYSLKADTLGQCLYTKSFGPNAISVSISPRNNHVLVGMAAKRLIWVFTTKQLVGQVYKLETPKAGENSTKHVLDVMHPCDIDMRSHVSVNSARWMPTPGHGLVYGTNRGDLQICRPGSIKDVEEEEVLSTISSLSRRNLMNMFGGMSRTPVTVNSIATQTPAVRRTMSTQTDPSEDSSRLWEEIVNHGRGSIS